MSNTETLDRAACLALLRTVALGRVAWTDGTGRVVVEPVNFVLEGDDVVFRTAEGEKLEAVRRGRSFSFEADEVEPALRVGWSVLVSGPAEIVSEAEQSRRSERPLPVPWDQSTPRPYLVRIRAEQVSGRRLRQQPGGVSFVEQ